MSYKFNKDLEIQHICSPDRVASYWKYPGDDEDASGIMLIEQDRDYQYVVADFDKNGFCINAESFLSYDQAWDNFIKGISYLRAKRDKT